MLSIRGAYSLFIQYLQFSDLVCERSLLYAIILYTSVKLGSCNIAYTYGIVPRKR